MPIGRGRAFALAAPWILLALLTDGRALAKKRSPEWEESDKLPAVQNRLYRNEHEFMLGIGVLPVDAFYKGVLLNGGYTWHFSDLWGLEGRFSYSANTKTSLRTRLENGFPQQAPTGKFAELSYYGEVGPVFKPIYGKLSFLNKTLVYGEIYLSLTGVVGLMKGGLASDQTAGGFKGEHVCFGAAPGFGIRAFVTPRLSVRFDFRYLLLYSDGDGYFPLALTLNFAYSTRSDL
jgi:outer membrane beta-barrel protein